MEHIFSSRTFRAILFATTHIYVTNTSQIFIEEVQETLHKNVLRDTLALSHFWVRVNKFVAHRV